MSLVETHRENRRVRHEHIASLGSIEMPPSVAAGIDFWRGLHERLDQLSNRLDAETRRTSNTHCSSKTRSGTQSNGHRFLEPDALAAVALKFFVGLGLSSYIAQPCPLPGKPDIEPDIAE